MWFSLQNMVTWGLGLPLGILSWAGFLWMGWRIFKGGVAETRLLWGWAGVYFVWQSIQWNSTMRYQLPIYPLLAIFAAWLVFDLWDRAGSSRSASGVNPRRILAFGLGIIVLVLTLLWAVAFTRIYTQPHTRVAATRWLFQNMPGAVNLVVQTQDGDRKSTPGLPPRSNPANRSPLRSTLYSPGGRRTHGYNPAAGGRPESDHIFILPAFPNFPV